MINISGTIQETDGSIFLSTASDMKKMDGDCVTRQNISFAELMEKAAKAAFDCIVRDNPRGGAITILCGSGNNGGDGYVLALLFAGIQNANAGIRVINISGEPPKSEAALFHYNKIKNIKAVEILNAQNLSDEKLQEIFSGSSIIIDAVFGTGFKGELTGEALRVIKSANNAASANSKISRISIDVPSGVDCDNGTADENSFKADLTVTFEFIKRGLPSYPAAGFTGDIKAVSIGFDKKTRDIVFDRSPKSILLSHDYVRQLFDACNKRKLKNTNKGDFGRLLMICGSKNMTGAAYFAAMGALRTGTGLVYLASEEKALDILQTKLNEPVFVPMNFDKPEDIIRNIKNIRADSILIGPGLGIDNSRRIINIFAEPRFSNLPKTIIFDADGINALCGNINILNQLNQTGTETVLTPHPGEMARLCNAAGFDGVNSPADVQKNRIGTASDFALKYNCTLVLKGANTVIACKNGDIYINPTGNPGMSKGGSGDILAGMAASYCAQGIPPENAACIAVYLHGLAGDRAAERYSETGMLPSDMLIFLPEIQK